MPIIFVMIGLLHLFIDKVNIKKYNFIVFGKERDTE